MKFYSEILNKCFDTAVDCTQAEMKYERELEEKKQAEEEERAKKIAEKEEREKARKEESKKVEEAYRIYEDVSKEAKEALKIYEKVLSDYCKKYGAFSFEFDDKKAHSLLKDLLFWF